MCHFQQLKNAYIEKEHRFDFDDSFEYIAPYFQGADIAMANLETTIAGRDNARRHIPTTHFNGFQGYNFFNSPESILATLSRSGFDILSTANNHTLDSGYFGAWTTWERIQDYGMLPLGTQPKGTDSTIYIENNGIKLAFLSYTFSTNGISISQKDFEVNNLKFFRRDLMNQMKSNVTQASTQADFVIIMIHFGKEYAYKPSQQQYDIVNHLFNAGADVILGDHPHVLQPLEFRTLEKANNTQRTGVVIYSLGNLISAQQYPNAEMKSKDAGVILNLTFSKNRIRQWISSVSVVPTWVQRTKENFIVLPVDDTLNHRLPITLNKSDTHRLAAVQKESLHILSKFSDTPPAQKKIGYHFEIPKPNSSRGLESAALYREK